jgi:hypothetical protein
MFPLCFYGLLLALPDALHICRDEANHAVIDVRGQRIA